jgi:hypothetical protein
VAPPSSGIFVVRVWFDGESFRARVQYTTDLAAGPMTESVTADPDDVRVAVDRWLRALTPTEPSASG